jgi:hypothetical protein
MKWLHCIIYINNKHTLLMELKEVYSDSALPTEAQMPINSTFITLSYC